MSSFDKRDRTSRQLPPSQTESHPSPHAGIEDSGLEAIHLRHLVDSRTRVVVVLTTGDTLRGRVRYYDRDCFSLGPEKCRPKVFLRKEAVKYLYVEQEESKTPQPLTTVAGDCAVTSMTDVESQRS